VHRDGEQCDDAGVLAAADWNWVLLVSTNGAVKEMLPGDMPVPVVESHWPTTAPEPVKGDTGLLKPSVARHVKTWFATFSPHSMPRWTFAGSAPLNSARDEARCLSNRASCAGS
jgi:hypothetical protein